MKNKIAFVGAGIATSYTLIPLLDSLKKNPGKEVELLIFDKSKDFFKGLPYGDRSGNSVLLIQDLEKFISEPHRSLYKQWLDENKEELVNEFLEHGGNYAQKWVDDNKPFYDSGHWDKLYIPRFFFGKYIEDEVLSRIKDHCEHGNLSYTLINEECSELIKLENGYEIGLMNGERYQADKVVLAMGSLPYKKLIKKDIYPSLHSLYIKEPYNPSTEENLAEIQDFIAKRTEVGLSTNILVLGANASGLEMVYKICDNSDFLKNNLNFTILSSHGMMPDGQFDEEKAKGFRPEHLEALSGEKDLTAEKIANAAHKDLDVAESHEIGAATTVAIISEGFGKLLPKLSEAELLNFARFHGNQIGRRQRCAGSHYLSVVDLLTKNKRFEHIRGRYLELNPQDNGITLSYSTADGQQHECDKMFNVVFNCLGSLNLESTELPPFIKGLLENGLCKANPSKIGFEIDENLQTSENLYVAGPLLAGNKIGDKVFWHLEHCVRIIWSSQTLAEKIEADLV